MTEVMCGVLGALVGVVLLLSMAAWTVNTSHSVADKRERHIVGDCQNYGAFVVDGQKYHCSLKGPVE